MSFLRALRSYRGSRSHNPYQKDWSITVFILFSNWEVTAQTGACVHAYGDFISSDNILSLKEKSKKNRKNWIGVGLLKKRKVGEENRKVFLCSCFLLIYFLWGKVLRKCSARAVHGISDSNAASFSGSSLLWSSFFCFCFLLISHLKSQKREKFASLSLIKCHLC